MGWSERGRRRFRFRTNVRNYKYYYYLLYRYILLLFRYLSAGSACFARISPPSRAVLLCWARINPSQSLSTPLRVYQLRLIDSGRGTTKAEDAHGTPTQSHISPSILVYDCKWCSGERWRARRAFPPLANGISSYTSKLGDI